MSVGSLVLVIIDWILSFKFNYYRVQLMLSSWINVFFNKNHYFQQKFIWSKRSRAGWMCILFDLTRRQQKYFLIIRFVCILISRSLLISILQRLLMSFFKNFDLQKVIDKQSNQFKNHFSKYVLLNPILKLQTFQFSSFNLFLIW